MRTSLKVMGMGAAAALAFGVAAATPLISSALATTSTSTVNVTIAKFVDGQQATASTSNSTMFPFSATWQAANLNGGASTSGTFSLGPTGMNTATPYQAVTADMTAGADYAVNEQTGNTTTGTDCSGTQPFRLVGYSTGSSLAAAQSASVSTTSPNFTNLTGNQFVIAWNRYCLQAPTPVSPANGSATTTAGQTMVDWTDVTNPVGGITYTYQASNASSTNANGAFTSPIFTSGPLSSSTIATPNTPSGTYFWHVMATDAHGNQSAWSPTWMFTVTNGTSTGTTTPPTATSTVQVHILKYLDGAMATASSSNNTLFPMTATWTASNLNSGTTTTGTYNLGDFHGGATNQYGADTAGMATSSSYTTSEVTGTTTQFLPAGVDCTNGKYQLVGYTSSPTSFANAASMSPSTSAPSFTNLQGDQYVIVWNHSCGNGTTTPPTGTGSLWVQKFSIGGSGTFNFMGTGGIGSFNITTTSGWGSKTITGLAPGNYTVTEPGPMPGNWRRFINTCHAVHVHAGQTAFCFIVDRLPVNQWDHMGENNGSDF